MIEPFALTEVDDRTLCIEWSRW